MTSSDKEQILETITAVSRLITLAFKPPGTKIAIRNHNIVLCEPSDNNYYGIKFAQGIDRYWNGDSREDIYVINHVICNFIDWYIIPSKKDDTEVHKGLINLTKYLCVGLKELQKTYKKGTVVGTLQYYINVLLAVIDGTFKPWMLYNHSTTGRKSFLDENNTDDDTSVIYSTIFDIDKFKNFWTKTEIKSLCSQFDQCFKMPDEPDNIVFRENDEKIDKEITEDDVSNDDIETKSNNGDSKDEVKDTKSTTTTIATTTKIEKSDDRSKDKDIQRKLPVPRNQTNVLVKGHLVGITDILNIMDKRFSTMLNQSIKSSS